MTLKIMITGASGQLGAQVIDALLRDHAGDSIGALVRRPDAAAPLQARGVTVRIASYDDVPAMTAAFAGVERLLLISSSEVGQRAAQHANVITAAKAAGVAFIAYTSLLGADRSPLGILPTEHVATEAALAASGLHHAILRNGWYTENYAMSAAGALQHGALIGAAGQGRISSASRADYADAAAAVLAKALPPSGTVYELAGDDAYTLEALAVHLSDHAGKLVPYINMSEADYAAALIGAGLPEGLAHMLADSDRGAAEGGLFSTDRTLSRLIGRPTTPWHATITAVLG